MFFKYLIKTNETGIKHRALCFLWMPGVRIYLFDYAGCFLRLVFTSDGVGVGVVVGIIREHMT